MPTAPKNEGSDVEEGLGGMRWHKISVLGDGKLEARDEVEIWDGGNGYVARGVGEPCCVDEGSEDVDFAV